MNSTFRRHAKLTALAMAAILAAATGAMCPPPTTGPDGGLTPMAEFPKSAEWTRRSVNSDAAIRPVAVAVADFDQDGLNDVLAGYAGLTEPGTPPVLPSLFIFFQVDVNNFDVVPILANSALLNGLTDLSVGDLDNDTQLDIVAACNGQILYLHAPINPRLPAGWMTTVVNASNDLFIGQWNDILIGDVDQQLGPDIVACSVATDGSGQGRVSWFRSPAVNPINGTGWQRIDVAPTDREGAASVELADIDADMRADIVSTAPSAAAQRIVWHRNPADPTIGNWDRFPIGNLDVATRLAVGDLNGDNLIDVVATNPTGRQIGWYRNPTDPTTAWSGFLLAEYISATPTDLRIVDVDANNQPDVIVSTRAPGSFRWFTPVTDPVNVWTENNMNDVVEAVGRFAIGEINNGPRRDVVAPLQGATTNDDSFAWFENPEP